ncbi:MAG: AAA family ATPase [bacterium]
MIKRIKIQGYKSFKSLELHLNPLSVLFGPNAAGKSNFLDALQLLSRIATSQTLKEAFEPPYRGKPLESFWFREGGIEGLLQRESALFSMEADIELSPAVIEDVNQQIVQMRSGKSQESDGGRPPRKNYIHKKNLQYRIEIEILPRAGLLRVVDEYLAPLGARGQPIERQPYLERMGHRLHLRMEGQSHPSYFERHLDHSIISKPHYPPHYPHLTALKKEMESWLFFYFEPRERMRAVTAVKEVRHIGLMGEELAAFLNTLKSLAPRQFETVEKALKTIIPSITGIRLEVNKMGEVELSLMEGDVAVPARVVSEGTLRVLGLLALSGVKQPPALIGFEEPENGVHPRRIRAIAELLKNRVEETQLVVTTHSPILSDLMPDDSLFVCRKDGGATVIEPFASWGPLGRRSAVDKALDEKEERLPVSERMLRGDFDA